jgi:N-acetylmuramoyl-L-alanine amidase
MTVIISAGHYPEKPGVCYEDFCEHAEAVKWAGEINGYLVSKGVPSLLAPTGVLSQKVEFINSRNPTLALEVHFNSFKVWKDANADGIIDDDELMNAGRGSETLYYPGSQKGVMFAHNVQERLAEHFQPDRGIKEGWYRMNPKNGPDFFLARTRCPAIIVEPDFIHRVDEIVSQRNTACIAIAEAVIKTRDEL